METTGLDSTPPPPLDDVQPRGGGVVVTSTLPRNIFLLNFFFVSVGYFVIGQWKKGLSALAAAIVIVPLTLGFGLPVWNLITAIDGAMQAGRLVRGQNIRQWSVFAR